MLGGFGSGVGELFDCRDMWSKAIEGWIRRCSASRPPRAEAGRDMEGLNMRVEESAADDGRIHIHPPDSLVCPSTPRIKSGGRTRQTEMGPLSHQASPRAGE